MSDAGIAVVLMAGGTGERFWPRSRPHRPKQFLDLDGRGSLLQQTYRRALGLVSPTRIFVSTRSEYADLVGQQLPELPRENLILEPEGRDTAPGLGLAALMVSLVDPATIMVALPADHVITEEARFLQTLRAAVEAAVAHQSLVTLGVHPTRPETGYGYIQVGDAIDQRRGLPVHRVQRFVEKPDSATAHRYLGSGDYLWNSGMFVWPVSVLREEIALHLPELHGVLDALQAQGDRETIANALPQVFPLAPRISIDYGVLERSTRVLVVPAYFGWDDVGSWAALERLRPVDADGNVIRGPVSLHQSRNVVVEAEGRTVAVVGVSDLIIVDSEDALLVCHKQHTQAVKQVAAAAEQLVRKAPRFPPVPTGAVVLERSWGREHHWAITKQFVGKLFEIRVGQYLQFEGPGALYFQRGLGRLRVAGKWREVTPGDVYTLDPGTECGLETHTGLTVIVIADPSPEL